MQHRQPRGLPIGGQYATDLRSEADLDLGSGDGSDGRRGELRTIRHPGLIEPTEATEEVLTAIERTGGRPLMVGGCVRDAVLGDQHPKDIDIEVYGLDYTDRLAHELSRVGRVDEVGKSFGVLKVLVDGEDFDVSLPRRERKTGPGHKGVEVEIGYIDPVDATGRRDYTVNAMLYDPRRGEITDCWRGLDDIESGVLRHMTSAFGDDPLRVMRGIRFSSKYGWDIDEQTAEFCRSLSGEYDTLPSSRLWGEWNRITGQGTHMSQMLRQLDKTGWVVHYPQLARLHDVEQDTHWHPEGSVWAHTGQTGDEAARIAVRESLTGEDRTVVVMASLLHDVGKAEHTQHTPQPDGSVRITSHGHAAGGVTPAAEFLASIGAPRQVVDRVLPLVSEHMSSVSTQGPPTRRAVAQLARRLGSASVREWAMVVEADRSGRGSASLYDGHARQWVQMAENLGVDRAASKRLLTGEVLIAAGMKPGPDFRRILDASIEAQDAGEFIDVDGASAWFASRSGGR